MNSVDLAEFGPIISSKTIGEQIYEMIKAKIKTGTPVVVQLQSIKSMATFCAKQIFGRLYLELGSEAFFEKIILKGADQDLKTIIQIGIQNALEKNSDTEDLE